MDEKRWVYCRVTGLDGHVKVQKSGERGTKLFVAKSSRKVRKVDKPSSLE